jgi:hypothetical protein
MKYNAKKISSLLMLTLLIATILTMVVYAQNDENILDANNSTVNNSTISNSTISNSTDNINLLLNANFTNGSTLADYWSIDENVSGNVRCVITPNMQSVCYRGQSGDDGTKRLKIYQAPITGVAAGDKIRFSILVSGNINSSPTIVGIAAANSSKKWLGESDTYINVSNTPKLYEVTYVCPQNTSYVAVYLECMEINSDSIIDFSLEKAELVHTP